MLACALNLVFFSSYCLQIGRSLFAVEIEGGAVCAAYDPDDLHVPTSHGGSGYWTYLDWSSQVKEHFMIRSRWPEGGMEFCYWVRIPLWMIFVPSFAGWLYLSRKPRRTPGRCARCGYDLTGNVAGRCPECGTAC